MEVAAGVVQWLLWSSSAEEGDGVNEREFGREEDDNNGGKIE